jgi:hypothetical protein
VDCSATSFLPICESCRWRGLPRSTRADARRVAESHAQSVHADERAVEAAAKRRRRALIRA